MIDTIGWNLHVFAGGGGGGGVGQVPLLPPPPPPPVWSANEVKYLLGTVMKRILNTVYAIIFAYSYFRGFGQVR